MAVENCSGDLVVALWVLLMSSWISMTLRCYARVVIVKSFGVDDWFMLAALVFFTLYCISSFLAVRYGTGRHRVDLTQHDYERAKMAWWFCMFWYCLTMTASKISIGYFLLRIIIRRLQKILIYTTMFLTAMTGIVFFFVSILQCRPIRYYWNHDQPGSCIDIEIIMALTYVYSTFAIISDFTCAILPMFLIWKLNMGLKTKIALIPIMTMAYVASSAVAVRLPYVKTFTDPDFLWATIGISFWSTIETGLAVTAGNLATLGPLIRYINKEFISKSSTSQEPQLFNTPENLRGGLKNRNEEPLSFGTDTFSTQNDKGTQILDIEVGDINHGPIDNKSSAKECASGGRMGSRWNGNESEEVLTAAGGRQA